MAKETEAQEEAPVNSGHPTKEHRDFHNNDQRLRAAGYRIEHRPKNAEAIWSFKRINYRESEALQRISKPPPEPS